MSHFENVLSHSERAELRLAAMSRALLELVGKAGGCTELANDFFKKFNRIFHLDFLWDVFFRSFGGEKTIFEKKYFICNPRGDCRSYF